MVSYNMKDSTKDKIAAPFIFALSPAGLLVGALTTVAILFPVPTLVVTLVATACQDS